MSEFIFMLTRSDVTIPDALDVYASLREVPLRWIGFKDIGQPVEVLRRLTEQMHADGRSVVLEVVSVDAGSEISSVRIGLDIGVDIIMGGTRPDLILPLLAGRPVRYFPFPGRVVGHPSVLTGSIDDVVTSAAELSVRPGIHGLDLLAYRHSGDIPALMRRVVTASRGPVVVAGSIDSPERLRAACDAGAWAFTIGSSIFDGSFAPGASVPDAVRTAITMAAAGGHDPQRVPA